MNGLNVKKRKILSKLQGKDREYYICKECNNPCILEVDKGDYMPAYCPYGDDLPKPKWKREK